ncbi:uncharacterized protein RMCFA_2439 [Mycolicibacterium fortuitum subsp. acetamidolyticum]|uniref:Uncharacterized protein n=1 Tax=Mycolicibacterium fortuitum subsp. acetamidolyticum TaxID=144550 RepID=A0A100WQ62_MYCFO|nr:uncharacterized protein RMCFA_2439 [Mycolicibacterium fortuitum subsp. acetamidolyticum]
MAGRTVHRGLHRRPAHAAGQHQGRNLCAEHICFTERRPAIGLCGRVKKFGDDRSGQTYPDGDFVFCELHVVVPVEVLGLGTHTRPVAVV